MTNRFASLSRRGLVGLGLMLGFAGPGHADTDIEESALGSPDATVTIVEYSSLTCPHCAAFHREVLPELKERYIDTGKVKFVIRDFPLDQVALKAAMVAHCAGDDRYYQFIDVLFAQQDQWARSADPVAALKQIGRLGGLSGEQVDACLADSGLEEQVLKSRLDAQQQWDITSTPTFIIGGKAYSGNRTVDDFAELIDPLLG